VTHCDTTERRSKPWRQEHRSSTLNTWGWIAIVTGTLQAVAGLMVLSRRFAGQWLAGVLAVVGIFVSFFSIGAYAIWSVIALATNGLVLWAVTAHGDEFDG
jgi:hypothetical protein